MTEKEIKVMLDREQYEEIKSFFHWDEVIHQVNHYYVNSDTDSGKKLTIRVRDKDSRHFLQIKRPMSEDSSLHISEEYEKEIFDVPELLSSEVLTGLTGFHIPDSRFIGSLFTERRLSREYPGVEICLDRVEYYDVVEYELELEYCGDYPEEVTGLLEEHGIGFGEKARGKYYRFLKYVKEKNE